MLYLINSKYKKKFQFISYVKMTIILIQLKIYFVREKKKIFFLI